MFRKVIGYIGEMQFETLNTLIAPTPVYSFEIFTHEEFYIDEITGLENEFIGMQPEFVSEEEEGSKENCCGTKNEFFHEFKCEN
jgi:hypothetical protein